MPEPAHKVDLRRDIFIPVAADAARELEGRSMLRAAYFVVTTSAPTSSWEIELPPLAPLFGIGAVGILGVVFSAMGEPGTDGTEGEFGLFRDADDVAAIFALEHDAPLLSVQLEDAWIPHEWFLEAGTWENVESRHDSPERGDIYRIGLAVFQASYRYTAGDIGLDELMESDWADQVLYSPVETEAIRSWSQSQIDLARRNYQEQEVRLPYLREGRIIRA